jgi:hypothetical protein
MERLSMSLEQIIRSKDKSQPSANNSSNSRNSTNSGSFRGSQGSRSSRNNGNSSSSNSPYPSASPRTNQSAGIRRRDNSGENSIHSRHNHQNTNSGKLNNMNEINESSPRTTTSNPRDPAAVKFLLTNFFSGIFIGSGGSSIREMESICDASVHISNVTDVYPGTNFRVVYMSGSEPAVTLAQSLMWEMIGQQTYADLTGKGPILWNPSSAKDSPGEMAFDSFLFCLFFFLR